MTELSNAASSGLFGGRAAVRLVCSALIAAAVAALYAPTVHYPFHFDDHVGILENEKIRDLSDIGAIWRYNPSRFMVFLSFAVNHHMGGYETYGYHIVNIAVHAAASVAFFYFLALLFQAADALEGRRANPLLTDACALAAAMVFAVHPLQTEAVTFIWQRSTSIGSMFFLASMAFYLRSALDEKEGRSPRRWGLWLGLSAASCLLAMLSKQFAFTLPVALGMVEVLVVSGPVDVAKRWKRLVPFAAMLPIIPIFTALEPKGEMGDLVDRAERLLSTWQYLISEFNVIVFVYLKLLFYPSGLNLDYDFPASRSFMDSAAAFFILAAILGGGLALYKRNRVACAGVLFFFITASVESSILALEDLVFEHRIYLPMAGALAAMAALLRMGLEKAPGKAGPAAAAGLVITLCVPLAAATHLRNQDWSSARRLMEDVVAKSPNKTRGYNNLAAVLTEEGDLDGALAVLFKAKAIKPRDAFTLLNIGRTLERKGDHTEAFKYFTEAMNVNPKLDGAASALGAAFYRMKRFDDAAKYFTLAHNLKPWLALPRLNLGAALYQGGRLRDAVKVFESVLKRDPDNGKAHFGLAHAYLGLGEEEKAAAHMAKSQALGYKPGQEK